jgi:hypothetical protein
MEDKTDFIEPLFERVQEYSETSCKLFKLKALDKTAGIVSRSVSRGVVILVLFMLVVVLSIGIALWLGDLLGKSYYGFFYVAGFYGLIALVLYFFMHNWIRDTVRNSIISQMLK